MRLAEYFDIVFKARRRRSYTLIQEQLGLKPVGAKAPMDVIVVDHVEKPTEN